MTGYARQSEISSETQQTWEIRTINHRYLELSFRIPETMRDLEPSLRKIAKSLLYRGKIEASLKYLPNTNTIPKLEINQPLLQAIINAQNNINTLLKTPATMNNTLELLSWPGMINCEETVDNSAKQQTIALFEKTCIELSESRSVEGTAIAKTIQQRIKEMQTLLDQVKQQTLSIRIAYETKLKSRIEELSIDIDPYRLEQEIVFYLQKADIDEEIDRLQVHFDEFNRRINDDTAVGRRLDFILQEINREINTLGSKAFNTTVSQMVVDLKVLTEQIREQIQNVE